MKNAQKSHVPKLTSNAKGIVYTVTIDFRNANKFCTLYVNERGMARAVKGVCTNESGPLEVLRSDTSGIFKLDSVSSFYNEIFKLRGNPDTTVHRHTMYTIEAYYKGQMVMKTSSSNGRIWDLFRPIMHQIPEYYNPFTYNGHNPVIE